MREVVESYFKQRSLVNHQLASYNDCIPIGDGKESRMEKIVRSIKIGSDEEVIDDEGGLVITVNEVDGLIGKQRMGVLMILLFFVSEEHHFKGIFP